ncbi:MAG: DNA alkylation repair protein [Candidatus Spyradosoma sp.]
MKDAARQILGALKAAGTPEKAAVLRRFFKTGPGEYGEGDRFLGVTVPATRAIAKAHADAPFAELAKLLKNPFHEARLCALLVLVERFRAARRDARERRRVFEFYLAHARRCDNWDLVDLTAPKIVGEFLAEHAGTPETDARIRALFFRLAESDCLWEQRIAVVSALAFIRRGDFSITFALADRLAPHPHDLMRKANGWMLREVGKRDRAALTAFLETRAATLPRTMLRYAIEHYTPAERARWRAL